MRTWLFLPALALAACTGPEDSGDPIAQLEGPTLEHSPTTESLDAGGSVYLEILASDPDGVRLVTAYHRTTGSTYWDSTPLEDDDGEWYADLEDLEAPGLEYYFKATDDGEEPATSYLPEGATTDPYALEVLAAAQALPWFENFELLPEETSLFTMDWWSPTEEFSGYPWELSFSDQYSGESCALHQRGAESVGELSDWLVSPGIDFSSLDEIMIRWMERGSSVDSIGTHALYISTGSRDLDDGDFELVEAELPAPDEDWARSESYDLSAWAGAPVVYIGWHYMGEAADDWYIDDIEVLELAPDLDAILAWAPDPVNPGETANLTIAIDNHTTAEAVDLSAILSLPDGGGTITDPEQSIALIDAEGSVDLSFSLDLDADLHDNRRLPLLLELDDGVDYWELDLEMVVGVPSEASITLTVGEDASLQWVLGVGDPDDPTWEMTAHAGLVLAGQNTLSVDITDAYEMLPPAAGPNRWYSTVSADVAGSVDEMEILYGGESFEATQFRDFGPDSTLEEPGRVYIPEPPDFLVLDTVPSSASPGETVGLNLTVYNSGDDTAGPVSGVIRSVDAGSTVVSGESFTVTEETWFGYQTWLIVDPVIEISEEHIDSTAVQLELELTDGLEIWVVDLEIPVPWPVLKISFIEIDDSGGDGVLDAGESASLGIEITNVGDMSTFSTVDGVLSAESSSSAGVSFTEDEGYFGSLSSGSSRDEDDFELSVSGSSGDTVDLLLSLDDGSVTYEARTQLVLGEPPWQSLNPTDDEIGDVLDDYEFDIVNGKYRVVDGRVELVLESDEPYDATTLFLEAWGTSSGADFLYYRWVLQSGGTTLQGYDSSTGFETIGTLDVDFIDDTHVMWSWAVEDMGLFSDEFSIGIAAGWCGPDEYYCDHFPDGWGYPYVSFSTSSWFDLTW